jgi:hypothetical protein
MKGPRSREEDVGRRHDAEGANGRTDLHGRRGADQDRDNGGGEPEARHGRRVSGSVAVVSAKTHLAELTGQRCESVSALNPTRDGWRVVVEVLELERIPRTTDILASYVVDLDQQGELLGYERAHRYYRNDVDGD